MATDFVTRWLMERKPDANVTYLGLNADDIHVWDLEFPEVEHTFRVGIVTAILDDEGRLAKRLMEVESQGWLDRAGEKDHWILVADREVAEGRSLLDRSKPSLEKKRRSRSTQERF
jgi:hypothetical protein